MGGGSYKDVELDLRFDDHYTLDGCFYASCYHRMTGAILPPNQHLVRDLIGREDVEVLNGIASHYDISECIEALNPRDQFKKGLYRSFSYVLAHRKFPCRATRATELIANAAIRGDDETMEALIEDLDWCRAPRYSMTAAPSSSYLLGWKKLKANAFGSLPNHRRHAKSDDDSC